MTRLDDLLRDPRAHGSWVAALLWLFPLLTAGAGQVGEALGSTPSLFATLADPWLLLPLCAAIVLALTPPLRERLLAELD